MLKECVDKKINAVAPVALCTQRSMLLPFINFHFDGGRDDVSRPHTGLWLLIAIPSAEFIDGAPSCCRMERPPWWTWQLHLITGGPNEMMGFLRYEVAHLNVPRMHRMHTSQKCAVRAAGHVDKEENICWLAGCFQMSSWVVYRKRDRIDCNCKDRIPYTKWMSNARTMTDAASVHRRLDKNKYKKQWHARLVIYLSTTTNDTRHCVCVTTNIHLYLPIVS